jgi:phosphoglycerate dehydrogenase-like enzyme
MLDVHENEPSTNEALRKMALHGPTGGPNRGRANVMLTCHNAGGTLETHYAFERVSMENVLAVLEGKEPLSAVNAHLIAK